MNELCFRVGKRRAGRLMCHNGIQVMCSRKLKRTTDSNDAFNFVPNLLRRDLMTIWLIHMWAGDLTYVGIW